MQNTNYLRAGRGHRDDEILSINAFRATPMSLDVEWQLDNNDPFFFNPSYPPPELPSFRLKKKKKKGKLSRDYFTRINLKFADIDDIHDGYPRWIIIREARDSRKKERKKDIKLVNLIEPTEPSFLTFVFNRRT